MFQFYTPSPRLYGHTQELLASYHELHHNIIRLLGRGQAAVWTVSATDRCIIDEPQVIQLRPSIVDPGGHTLSWD